MNKRQLGIAALGIAVAVAGVGIVVAQLADPADQVQSMAESSASATAEPTPDASTPPTPPTGTDGPDGAAPAPTEPPERALVTGPGTAADATPRTSTEVLPSEPEPVILPPSQPRTALVAGPLPPTASSRGAVVSGFPSDAMPGIPDSIIDSSSVATEGDRLQATLDARTALRPEDVLAFYRQHFAPLGLLETPSATSQRSTTLSFTRGDDSVTVAVTAVAGGSSYVLFGAFTAAD